LRNDGTATAKTTVSLEELSRNFPLNLGPDAEEHYRTLAVILSDKFGETPSLGASWEGYGAKFTVARLNGPAVELVEVQTMRDNS
jgi:CBS domain containing-hemolysin-like protein